MKMLNVIIFALASLIFFGCQEQNSILEPSSSFNNEVLTKKKPNSNTDIRSHYSKTYTINGKKGGKIRESHSWVDSLGNSIVMEATLNIPRGAFEGTLTFDIIFDLENLSVELYPSPFTFNKPVFLNLLFEGIDLSESDLNNMDFKYKSPDGKVYSVSYETKVIEQNYLEIIQAQLPHFSRYGWTR